MVLSRFRKALRCREKACRALAFNTCDAKVGDGSEVFDIPCVQTTLRPHIDDDLSWLRRVVNYRKARRIRICWRPQHKHATIGENKASIVGGTRSIMELHQFCFSENPPSGGLRSAPKTGLEKTILIQDETCHRLRTQPKPHQTMGCFRRGTVKKAAIQKYSIRNALPLW